MQLEAIDKDGNVRPLRHGESLADGERVHIPFSFMDANSVAARAELVAKHGHDPVRDADAEHQTRRRGYRRGFQALQDLLPTHDALNDAAQAYAQKRDHLETSRRSVSDGTPADAYNERSKRLENAWRDGKKSTSDNAAVPQPAKDAAQARAQADAAFADKRQRLANAWKQR
jgi:hypothetical protein